MDNKKAFLSSIIFHLVFGTKQSMIRIYIPFIYFLSFSTTSNSIGIMGFMNITSNSSSSNNYSNNNDQNNNVTRTSVSTMNNTACTLRFVRKLSRTSSTISLVYTHNGPELENISFSISVFAQLSSFVAVIICTVILVRKLAQSSRSDW